MGRGLAEDLLLHELEHLEDDFYQNEDNDNDLQICGVLGVHFAGEHVEQVFDDVESVIEDVNALFDFEILCRALVEGLPLIVL